jgi:hypothetical protein
VRRNAARTHLRSIFGKTGVTADDAGAHAPQECDLPRLAVDIAGPIHKNTRLDKNR